nr:MAG TPA: hypothetical protein [Caudoviricetes sp.]
MGWTQAGSGVVFVTYPVPGHPPGGLTDPPPVARTHGWSRSRIRAGAHPWVGALRTWALAPRACVAYVRETTPSLPIGQPRFFGTSYARTRTVQPPSKPILCGNYRN